jgi:uncharacterized protein YjiK
MKLSSMVELRKEAGLKMSAINQKFIEDLKELEYALRDGMVFSEEQKTEIILVCGAIIANAKE